MINKKVLMAVSVSVLLLGGCFNSETGASQRAANGETETHAPAKHEAKTEAPKVEEKAPAKAEEKAPATEEAPAKAEEKAPATEEAPAKAEEKAPATEEAPAKTEEAAAPAEEPKAEEKAAPATAAAAPDLGACKGCHGANFEKKAMGKSKIVKDLTKADIVTALKGYKDGSYGGAMKGLMKGQVASFDDATIEAIANTIGK
jgi:cytochrome c553